MEMRIYLMVLIAKKQPLIHVDASPRYAPGHQAFPRDHGVEFDKKGCKHEASVASHKGPPPLPDSLGYLDIVQYEASPLRKALVSYTKLMLVHTKLRGLMSLEGRHDLKCSSLQRL